MNRFTLPPQCTTLWPQGPPAPASTFFVMTTHDEILFGGQRGNKSYAWWKTKP